MKTFTKVLLIVFWLLGAGAGFTGPESSSPSDTQARYRYAVTESVDLSVQGHHVTLRIEHRAAPRALALTVAVPSWVAAWSHRSEQALTASSSHTAPPDGNS